MGDFGKFLIRAFLRKLLTVLGTFLLTHGIISDEEAGGLVDLYLEEAVGAALLAGSGAWTYLYQLYVRRKVVTALSLPEGAGPEALKIALGEKTEGGA